MTTNRLSINPLSIQDANFIYELVNMPEWKMYIGERNVNNTNDAQQYIENILVNDVVKYWTVSLNTSLAPIGIVTFIKRAYLEHHDIGFAFLKAYTRQGYAAEATLAVLTFIKSQNSHKSILAVTIPQNTNSIKLLEKLGFSFQKEIIQENEKLLVYELVY